MRRHRADGGDPIGERAAYRFDDCLNVYQAHGTVTRRVGVATFRLFDAAVLNSSHPAVVGFSRANAPACAVAAMLGTRAMKSDPGTPPAGCEKITVDPSGKLQVPDRPIIAWLEGDGIGPDIWVATRTVVDSAVQKAYEGRREIGWLELLAGEKAHRATDDWLPQQTLDSINEHIVAIKGPMATPVGGGIRSLNVALRQLLDLLRLCETRKVLPWHAVPGTQSGEDGRRHFS